MEYDIDPVTRRLRVRPGKYNVLCIVSKYSVLILIRLGNGSTIPRTEDSAIKTDRLDHANAEAPFVESESLTRKSPYSSLSNSAPTLAKNEYRV